jgi:hypothetical protein
VLPLIRMVVAIEMMALPVWAGAVLARPGAGLGPRLARLPAAVVLLAGALLVMAALVDGSSAVGVLRTQAVALGFLVFLAGLGVLVERVAGPRAAQWIVALAGWIVVGSVVWAGPMLALLEGPAQATAAQVAVHANPLVVAEQELGLVWLRQDLTYRISPFGESYSYLVPGIAWWKTLLVHVFVGSGLLVFSLPRTKRGEGADG